MCLLLVWVHDDRFSLSIIVAVPKKVRAHACTATRIFVSHSIYIHTLHGLQVMTLYFSFREQLRVVCQPTVIEWTNIWMNDRVSERVRQWAKWKRDTQREIEYPWETDSIETSSNFFLRLQKFLSFYFQRRLILFYSLFDYFLSF